MYLLDTNTLSELIRREPSPVVVARFEVVSDDELFTSAICIEEVVFGCRIAPPDNRIWERFETEVLPFITILDFDVNAAFTTGPMRGDWQRLGTPVGYADALIAGTAVSYGLTLVTRNTQHFDHVAGLNVENWFEPPAPGNLP